MTNQALFLWINHACAVVPDWLWSSITVTGDSGVLFALCTVLLRKPFLRTDTQKIITGLFITAFIGGVITVLVKEAFQIPRPAAVLAADQFHLIGHRLDVVSFPSGHTLSAFAVATLIICGLALRSWQAILIFCLAGLVGLSRIAVAAHWPFDVIGGALLGILCGRLGWIIAQRLHRLSWTESKIYAFLQVISLGLVSSHVLTINMGYPEAIRWQYIAAMIGIYFSSYRLLLLLKSIKSNKE